MLGVLDSSYFSAFKLWTLYTLQRSCILNIFSHLSSNNRKPARVTKVLLILLNIYGFNKKYTEYKGISGHEQLKELTKNIKECF